jgi:hypothetical protein
MSTQLADRVIRNLEALFLSQPGLFNHLPSPSFDIPLRWIFDGPGRLITSLEIHPDDIKTVVWRSHNTRGHARRDNMKRKLIGRGKAVVVKHTCLGGGSEICTFPHNTELPASQPRHGRSGAPSRLVYLLFEQIRKKCVVCRPWSTMCQTF